MVFKNFELTVNGIEGICKQGSLWGVLKDKNCIVPLIYFQKPKWIPEKEFKRLLTELQLFLPANFEIMGELDESKNGS